jgi:uncharacterized protein YoxC
MRKTLIAATVGEVVVLVGALAGYLLVIARTLRRVSRTLAQVTFGVRAIERHTEPVGASVRGINQSLERLEAALAPAAETRSPEPGGGDGEGA